MSLLLACLLALSPVSAAAPVDTARALDVLHRWDAARAEAWAAGDAGELRSLYVAGSSAGRSDARLLRSYAERGAVVSRIDVQIFGVVVQHSDGHRLVLRVLDRVAGGEVTAGRERRPLGTSPPVTRVVELRLVDGRWRVVSVREVSGRGTAPRAPPR